MTLNDMAYQQGNFDALSKFAALGQPFPAAGALSAVPPIAPAVPGTPAAAIKPGAPNQALPTSPRIGHRRTGHTYHCGYGETCVHGCCDFFACTGGTCDANYKGCWRICAGTPSQSCEDSGATFNDWQQQHN